MRFLPLALLTVVTPASVLADPVWDPTEITRLSQQAAQLTSSLSATIGTLRTFDKIATEIGSSGTRAAFSSSAPAALSSYASFQTSGMPAVTDAIGILSNSSPAATQQRQSRQIWQAASRQVAAEGVAVSQVANQDAGNAIARSKSLAGMVSSSQDLRGDVQANSAVGLAVLQEIGAMQAVLALLLEQQSVGRLTAIANNGAGS